MANKVAIPGLIPEHFKRFDESCVDLCDMLPNYGGRGKMALAELAKVLGLPGKPGQMDGSKVEELVDAGRSAEVANYCKSDVDQRRYVFGSWRVTLSVAHMSGRPCKLLPVPGLRWNA